MDLGARGELCVDACLRQGFPQQAIDPMIETSQERLLFFRRYTGPKSAAVVPWVVVSRQNDRSHGHPRSGGHCIALDNRIVMDSRQDSDRSPGSFIDKILTRQHPSCPFDVACTTLIERGHDDAAN
jgi:hypothetical protein